MKVIISVPGRFHIFKLAGALEKEGYLKKIITGNPIFIMKNAGVSEDKIYSIPIQFIGYLKGKYKFLNFFIPYSFEAVTFDYIASKYVKGAEIFHGFPNWMLKSGIEAKKSGILVVGEGSSTHILHREKTLSEEYRKLNIKFKSHDTLEIKRQIDEYKICDCLFAPSELVKRSFIEYGMKEEKIIQIYYGVDEIFFKKIERKKKNEIIIAGTIGVIKGTHILLEAYRKIKKKEGRLKLHLIGFFREDMKDIIEKNRDIIDFIGPIRKNDLPEYFSTVDIFVQPSLDDGFSLIVLEAMASGLPIVVSENTGISEIIQEGYDGYVVPVCDIEAVYKRLCELVYDDKKRKFIGEEATKKAMLYKWERYAKSCIQAYKNILEKR